MILRRAALVLVFALGLTVLRHVDAAVVEGNPEVMGHIKPPDLVENSGHRIGGVSMETEGNAAAAAAKSIDGSLAPPRVAIATVAVLTFFMAVVTGLGTLPFYFYELDERWKGACNGIACGVMLAASFDLIVEGQSRGGGHCVVIGILLGGLFIIVSQRVRLLLCPSHDRRRELGFLTFTSPCMRVFWFLCLLARQPVVDHFAEIEQQCNISLYSGAFSTQTSSR